VRIGVGLNALGLFLFAAIPVVLGIATRLLFPDLPRADLALPTILMRAVPPLVGAVGLAAVFSAEISAADAVLFMLTTSLSQDLYKRFVNPSAPDALILRVTRVTAVVSGVTGVLLALLLGSILEALTIFYSLLSVSLFVPIVGGLYVKRTTTGAALAAIAVGVGVMLTIHAATGGRGWGVVTPPFGGLAAAVAAWAAVLIFGASRHEPQHHLPA
jgi:solute:Na+ symporter, SSS family